jgi:adenylate cyclase
VLDPLSPMITEGLAENFHDAHRYDDAISTVLNMPDQKLGRVILAQSYIFKGEYQEALKMPKVADPDDLNGFIVKAAALARSGDRPAALKILAGIERSQTAGSTHCYIPPGYLAWAYSMVGEKEKAFAYLAKAYQQHDPALANLKVDPAFDSLRDDPRFNDLLKKVGFSN